MSARIDFAAVKAVKMSAVVAQPLELRRRGQEFVGLCPFHADRTPSFTVNDQKAFGHCFACGWHGDAVDFVAAVAGCDVREAVSRLGAGAFPSIARERHRESTKARSRSEDYARRIWRDAQPITGTAADRYLWRRGIRMNLPATLRFARLKHPEGGMYACLVAAVFSAEDGLVGIQRTFLSEDGRKAAIEPPKMSLGRIGGCAIRLAPPADELIVCEGAEDGLSVQQELGRAVWASAGASMLPSMQFPPIVQSVTIAADNDERGEREAAKAAACFAERGLKVRIMRPAADCKDFNEQLLSTGALRGSYA